MRSHKKIIVEGQGRSRAHLITQISTSWQVKRTAKYLQIQIVYDFIHLTQDSSYIFMYLYNHMVIYGG